MFGSMATTLTGIIVPSSWKTWVMPTLRPINPIAHRAGPRGRAQPSPGQGGAEHRSERTRACVSERAAGDNAAMGRISVRFITS